MGQNCGANSRTWRYGWFYKWSLWLIKIFDLASFDLDPHSGLCEHTASFDLDPHSGLCEHTASIGINRLPILIHPKMPSQASYSYFFSMPSRPLTLPTLQILQTIDDCGLSEYVDYQSIHPRRSSRQRNVRVPGSNMFSNKWSLKNFSSRASRAICWSHDVKRKKLKTDFLLSFL